MTPTTVIELARGAIETLLMVSLPLFLVALIVGQRRPPLDELVRDLDIPHRHTMSYHSL